MTENEVRRPIPHLEYGRLRAWYLASLRKRIIRQIEIEQLSPAALIAADRKAVENLILEKVEPAGTLMVWRRPPLPLQAFSIACICSVVFSELMLVAFIQADGFKFQSALFCCGALFVAIMAPVAVAVMLDRCIVRPLAGLSLLGSAQRDKITADASADPINDLSSMLIDLNTELGQARKRENAIADYALEFICALDSEARFAAVSPSSLDFLGYAWHELLGREFHHFVFSDDVSRITALLRSMSGVKGHVSFECRLRRKDGVFVDVQWFAEWSQTEQMVFCIGKDVSSQRRLDRVKKEFVSMIGHDLRTPLTSIACCLELLEDTIAMPDEAIHQVHNARESTGRVLKLISELLDLEKLETDKLPIHLANTALSGAIEKAVASVSSFALSKSVKIEVAGEQASVRADDGRLIQVLVNLLSNAIKFSPRESTVKLSVRCEGNKALVSISDNGPGIPEQYQDIIFERFQQVKSEHSSYGSGLGLSICRAIIFAHSGTIGVSSNGADHGSTFWFKLPLALNEVAEPLPEPIA